MTAPNRRLFRFSLRTLFVMLTLLACWIGWGVWTIRSATLDIERMPFVVVSVFIGAVLSGAFLTWLVAPQNRE